jgi:molybdopterin molybdotransferase
VNTRQFLDLEEAVALLRTSVAPLRRPPERVDVRSAVGRITAARVDAPMNVPPFTASAMDGYAMCSTDALFKKPAPYRMRVAGASMAGAPLRGSVAQDHAVRIFTGAVVPPRCDTVVIQEMVERDGDTITLQHAPQPGANIRPPGHDVRQGAPLIEAGTRLGPFDLAWLTACGEQSVCVTPRLRVALFSTGDELRDPPALLETGQIYDANRLALAELLRPASVQLDDLGIVADDPDAIAAVLREAADGHDVVLTSGGVSVGDADHVRGVVERLGQIEFWQIAIKPGKPLAYGRIGDCHFFGLPGNPVSTIVTFLMLVKPVLATLLGAHAAAPLRIQATLGTAIAHAAGRIEYQRGVFTRRDDRIEVVATSDQSSNRLGSFRGANCLIEIPRGSGDLHEGSTVTVLPLSDLLG